MIVLWYRQRLAKYSLQQSLLRRERYVIILEIKTCELSIYTMYHPDFIVCNCVERSFGLNGLMVINVLLFYPDYMNHTFGDTYERLSELVSPTLPVKYPRLPGHKPSPEENKYNAWYVLAGVKIGSTLAAVLSCRVSHCSHIVSLNSIKFSQLCANTN